MRLQRIAPGLHRWTAPHPAWEAGAEPESVEDWPEEVGCVLVETRSAVIFIDPQLPRDEDGAWRTLDARIRARPVHVLTTIRWHGRSRDAFVARYGAQTSRARARLPEGIEPFRIARALETIFWVSEHRTLVPGDRLIGDGNGGLRMCPASWLGGLPVGIEELRRALRPLLDLPVERVLVSHGEPVLNGGREAVARALA